MMALRELTQQRPAPWDSSQGALAFIDTTFDDLLGLDLVVDLLRIAGGEKVTSARTLSKRQFKLINQHRCVPLIPEQWECTPGLHEGEVQRVALLDMALVATMNQVRALLADVNVEPLVLKGMATSRLDYQRPDLRHSGDIDLLVRPDELPASIESLEAAGFTRKDPAQLNSEFLKGETLVSSSGVEVDIHTRLAFVGGSVDGSMLEGAPQIEDLGVAGLPLELRLVHAASHFFFGPPQCRRMSGFADITAIRSSPELSLEKTRDVAAKVGLEAPTFAGLAVESQLMGRDSSDLADWAEPEGLLRIGYSRPSRNRLGEQLFIASAQPTGRDGLRYLRQKLIPTTETRQRPGGFRAYASRTTMHSGPSNKSGT